MYNDSVFSLYLVGLKQLISQSLLHSFVAQIASSTVIVVSIMCLHFLVNLLNGYVCAAFDSTKPACRFLFHASTVYTRAPVCTARERCSSTIREILASHPFLDEHYLNASLYFEGWRGEWQSAGKRKPPVPSGFPSYVILVLFISSSQLLGTLGVGWSEEGLWLLRVACPVPGLTSLLSPAS